MQNSCAPVEQRKSCEGARTTAISYFVRKKRFGKMVRACFVVFGGKRRRECHYQVMRIFSLPQSCNNGNTGIYPFTKKESCNNATPAMDRAMEDSIRVTQLIDCAWGTVGASIDLQPLNTKRTLSLMAMSWVATMLLDTVSKQQPQYMKLIVYPLVWHGKLWVATKTFPLFYWSESESVNDIIASLECEPWMWRSHACIYLSR